MSQSLPIHLPLSARAKAFLVSHHAARLPGLTCPRADLEALLLRLGLPLYASVFAFEEAIGGLNGSGFTLGVCAFYREDPTRSSGTDATFDGEPLVAVGKGAGLHYFMNERGTIFGRSLFEPPARHCESAAKLLEKLAFDSALPAAGRSAIVVEIDRPPAEALASVLGLSPDPDASDSVQTIWQSERLTIFPSHRRHLPPQSASPWTAIHARDVDSAVEVLRAADRLATTIHAEISVNRLEEAVAPPSAAPSPRPSEIVDDTTAIELELDGGRAGEAGSIWARGTGDGARLDQLTTLDGQVIEWVQISGSAGRRLRFTGAVEALSGLLSSPALWMIEQGLGYFDPFAAGDRDELERLFKARDIPVTSAFIEFEEQFGGLTFTWGEPYCFGLCQMLRYSSGSNARGKQGRRLALCGTHEDTSYLMDEAGEIYSKPIEGALNHVAPSAVDFFNDLGLDYEASLPVA